MYLGIEAELNDSPCDLSDVVWGEFQLAIQTDINGEFAQTTTGKATSRNLTGFVNFQCQSFECIKCLVTRIWTKTLLEMKKWK